MHHSHSTIYCSTWVQGMKCSVHHCCTNQTSEKSLGKAAKECYLHSITAAFNFLHNVPTSMSLELVRTANTWVLCWEKQHL